MKDFTVGNALRDFWDHGEGGCHIHHVIYGQERSCIPKFCSAHACEELIYWVMLCQPHLQDQRRDC